MGNKQIRELMPYLLALALTFTCVVLISLAVGLRVWAAVLFAIGCAVLVWAVVFTILQFSRFARPRARKSSHEREVRRVVTVEPPTAEALPHHEDHAESPGIDQGQLTSDLPGSTPLVGRSRRERS